ncbi:MAG TPA: hypothetical protein VFB96_02380 [Pirellulaceae bacterium]|jgi:hypothetical protein|nr:hypothetical protein [Pirellulaceae bacterium]
MLPIRTISQWMAEGNIDLDRLVELSALDKGLVTAIVQGRYTPSPQQRQQLAAALGVDPEQVAWGHVNPVEHMYGHGPQFGRSP